jgi:hypothetical protein
LRSFDAEDVHDVALPVLFEARVEDDGEALADAATALDLVPAADLLREVDEEIGLFDRRVVAEGVERPFSSTRTYRGRRGRGPARRVLERQLGERPIGAKRGRRLGEPVIRDVVQLTRSAGFASCAASSRRRKSVGIPNPPVRQSTRIDPSRPAGRSLVRSGRAK